MNDQTILDDIRQQFQKYRTMAERALEQMSEEDFYHCIDPDSNSIALILKHMSGNMRSRWTDFLASDGEKQDRQRDEEFIERDSDSRQRLMERWEEGWTLLFSAMDSLTPADLARTVTIRGEAHTVLQALMRQLTHYAYHVGQIVLIAKHRAGGDWETLSIPRGRSAEFDVDREGNRYPVK